MRLGSPPDTIVVLSPCRYVEVDNSGAIESDQYACNAQCGDRVLHAPAMKVHSSSVGGDGKKPSGELAVL